MLIDNGRLRMREDPVLHEALYCIRCGACLNVCANFQSVGGHAFGGETYSGGIGGAWEAGTGSLENGRFSDLCTGCSRCVPQCPVRIDIPWLNEVLHQRLNEKEESLLSFIFKGFLPQDIKNEKSNLQKLFLGNFHHFAKWGARLAPLSNNIQNMRFVRILMEKYFGISAKRKLPSFTNKTLIKQLRSLKLPSKKNPNIKKKALLFSDVYTNYLYPERGIAAFKILKAFGIDLILSKVMPEGRAALSQGLIDAALKRAQLTAAYLEKWIKSGYDIVVIEPSALAMFRRDYKNLLRDEEQFIKLKNHCYEPLEYLHKLFTAGDLNPDQIFDAKGLYSGTKIFYHGHCQQKTIGAADQTVEVLKKLGLNVVNSQVECCGMAGSFGYKKDFYEVSMRDAEDLFKQIQSTGDKNNIIVLASGISCKDQISEGLGYNVLHPAEFLAKILI